MILQQAQDVPEPYMQGPCKLTPGLVLHAGGISAPPLPLVKVLTCLLPIWIHNQLLKLQRPEQSGVLLGKSTSDQRITQCIGGALTLVLKYDG